MDDELEEGEEKISVVLGVLGTLFFIVVDLVSLIPFVGDVESIISTLGMVVGFLSGGLGASVMAAWSVVTIAKYIPIVQELPLWTPTWLFVWYAMNHPSGVAGKALEVAQTASSVEQGIEAAGTGAKAAEEGAAAAEKGAGKMAEEGVVEAGKATEEAAVAGEAAVGAAETAEATEAAEAAKEAPSGQRGAADDEMTPENARNPMDVLGENIDMPDTDFDKGDGDEELPMAA